MLIRTPFKILLDVAENLKVKLPIQENDIEPHDATTGLWFGRSNKVFGEANDDRISRSYFTAPYSSNLHSIFEKFFNKNDIEATFLPKDRIALTDEILTRTSFAELSSDPFESFKGNFEIDKLKGIKRLIANNGFEEAYPLHEVE